MTNQKAKALIENEEMMTEIRSHYEKKGIKIALNQVLAMQQWRLDDDCPRDGSEAGMANYNGYSEALRDVVKMLESL